MECYIMFNSFHLLNTPVGYQVSQLVACKYNSAVLDGFEVVRSILSMMSKMKWHC